MKTIMILSLLGLHFTAMAAHSEILDCKTNQGELKVTITRDVYTRKAIKNLQMDITRGTEAVKTFKGTSMNPSGTMLTNSINNLIGLSENTNKVFDGHTEGVMLNIERTKASLAYDGSVYLLDCAAKLDDSLKE